MHPGEYDPPTAFEKYYRRKFAEIAEEFFDSAVRDARIDIPENESKADELHSIIATHKRMSKKLGSWKWFIGITSVVMGIWAAVIIFSEPGTFSTAHLVIFWAALTLAVIAVFAKAVPAVIDLSGELAELDRLISARKTEQLKQLSGIYSSFSWYTLTSLSMQVLPELRFDPYIKGDRIADLQKNFGVELPLDEKSSLLSASSGSYFGFPFVITRTRDFEMAEKTWEGSLNISWREHTKDANGKSITVTRHETLYASIDRPAPFYSVSTALFTGHHAAPDLNFSRKPSPVSGKDGFFSSLNRKLILGKLHRLEQNLTDDLPYTMMSNRDFEVQFHATDRNHEIQFRLLFTPLAQQQMVKLMNDDLQGYGDDFYFFKQNKAICLIPAHLQTSSFDGSPFTFKHFDLRHVKSQFMSYSQEFFRSIFFAFAPLMCIPLFNENRPPEKFSDSPAVSHLELETAVNFFGEKNFAHPDSITRNILKISRCVSDGNCIDASVTAYGFRGIEHVEYVPRMGGDGKIHQVPVHWIEYIPVSRTSAVRAEIDSSAALSCDLSRRSLAYFFPR